MKRFGKVALSVLMMAGATAYFAAPAAAEVGIGFSFGYDGPGYAPFSDPCDYYDYYDEPPPWGLPPDYCDYPVYFEPVYYDGYWYRGPIYYRWYGGERLFWLNGGWHRDGWRGHRPEIRWQDRGSHFRGGWGGRDGGGHDRRGDQNWSNRSWSGHNSGNWSGGQTNWSGGNRPWSGGAHNVNGGSHNWSGGSHNWSGGGAGHNWSGSGGGHSWSGGGGGGGGHNWSGGGSHDSHH